VNIGHLLFPGVTQLDLTAPLQAFSRVPGATTHALAKTLDAVATDCFSMLPTTAFGKCPRLDVLVIPGGPGVVEAISDEVTLTFVRSHAGSARMVASVCTGAFLLGAAGLLRGKRATTHWAYHELLPEVGAIPVRARVVRDDRFVSCAGVSAGLDGAFTMIAQLCGEDIARSIQLALEYDPAPPFKDGSPEKAEPEILERVRAEYGPRLQSMTGALARATRSAAPRLEERHARY
jgi:cyclohexyl-isocyanide hydratase